MIEREPGSDLEVRVLWGSRWQEPLAEQQPFHREVSWEGSCRQSPGLRNTNRIRGVYEMGERAKRLEARCHPDRVGVYAAGMWGEGHASYPGRPVRRSLMRVIDDEPRREAWCWAGRSQPRP